MLRIADVIESISGVHPQWAQYEITGAGIDSRQLTEGNIFFAFKGEHVDGNDFVEHAFGQGAIVAVIQKDLSSQFRVLDLTKNGDMNTGIEPLEIPFCIQVEDVLIALQQIARFWRRKHNPRVIGITGSVGKSTTKEVAAEVLSQRYYTLKSSGNLNNEIGLPLTLLNLNERHESVVLEMGFYVAGEIALLCDIALPHVGVVTNIGTVHAERAGSKEKIAQGKAELVEALPSKPEGVAILNYDDEWVRKMAEKTEAKVLYYGLSPESDLWADHIESLGLDGIRFRLHYRNEVHHLRVQLIGRHSVHTALRATAIGLVEGLTWQEIFDGLRSGHAQLRIEVAHSKCGALILDDTYNASPESMLAVLNLLSDLEGHKIAVLGDMLELGIYEKEGHERVGIRVKDTTDELITVGERARIIAESALHSGMQANNIYQMENNQEVIDFLRNHLSEGDVVLIKGSHGMHMEEIVGALELGQ